jgi:hypothetical protein
MAENAIAAPARRPFRKSPNQQRVVGRTVLWTVALSAMAFWIPHLVR